MSSDVTGDGAEDEPRSEASDADRIEFLHDRLVEIEVQHEDRLDEYQQRIQDLESTVESLQDRLDDVDHRTDVLRLAEKRDELDATQRRIALLLHLKLDAEDRAKNGDRRAAAVTVEQAKRALKFPDIDRTTYYTDFEWIEEFVDNKNICKYVSATGGDSRLKLDLEHHSLPDHVAAKLNGGA